jgi:hypothetical protein
LGGRLVAVVSLWGAAVAGVFASGCAAEEPVVDAGQAGDASRDGAGGDGEHDGGASLGWTACASDHGPAECEYLENEEGCPETDPVEGADCEDVGLKCEYCPPSFLQGDTVHARCAEGGWMRSWGVCDVFFWDDDGGIP